LIFYRHSKIYKCVETRSHSLLISIIKILRKIALSVEGWGSHCLTIVSLCSNIIVDIPSIVPLYKNEKKNMAVTQRTHSRFRLDWKPRAISLFSAKYTKVNARSNFCLESSKKKKKKIKSEAIHTKYSPTNSRLNIFLRFYGLSIRRHVENVGTLYGFARSTLIDRDKLILRR